MSDNDFKRVGYEVLDPFLSELSISQALSWINWVVRSGVNSSLEPEFEHDGTLSKIRRLFWSDSEFWSSWLRDSGLLNVVFQKIGSGATLIRHACFLKPCRSSSTVPPHQDQALWLLDYPGALTYWIPLVDATELNGCVQIWPKSHEGGVFVHDVEFDKGKHKGCSTEGLGLPVHCEISAGSLLIWDRFLVHSSDANRSNEDRPGVVFVFADSNNSRFFSKDVYKPFVKESGCYERL